MIPRRGDDHFLLRTRCHALFSDCEPRSKRDHVSASGNRTGNRLPAAHPAGQDECLLTDDRSQLTQESEGIVGSRMAAGALRHRDDPIDNRLQPLTDRSVA
jgi:hypothetical protein